MSRWTRPNSRRQVSLEALTDSLLNDLDGRFVGGRWRSRCPFHEGAENPTSFHVSREGRWGCFSCGVQGDDLDSLVAARTGLSVARAREALDNLPGRFRYVDELVALLDVPPTTGYQVLPETTIQPFKGGVSAYLLSRGFTPETQRMYGVGYDYSREKIVLPCRDVRGALVGYTLRQDGHTEHLWPKYEHSKFDKSLHLYGAHLAREWRGDLYVVEGQLDAQAVTQNGARGVAMMGAYLSAPQADILGRLPASRVIIATDNDDAGRSGERYAVMKQLRRRVSVESRLFVARYESKDPGEWKTLSDVQVIPWMDAYVFGPLASTTPQPCATIGDATTAKQSWNRPARKANKS